MHKAKFVQKVKCKYNNVQFERLMYNWEDDAEFKDKCFSSTNKIFHGDVNVFNFHPIHIILNSCDGLNYLSLKKSIANKSLEKLDEKYIKKFCHNGIGVNTFFSALLDSKQKNISIEDIR